jgi:hypothetical protein
MKTNYDLPSTTRMADLVLLQSREFCPFRPSISKLSIRQREEIFARI